MLKSKMEGLRVKSDQNEQVNPNYSSHIVRRCLNCQCVKELGLTLSGQHRKE